MIMRLIPLQFLQNSLTCFTRNLNIFSNICNLYFCRVLNEVFIAWNVLSFKRYMDIICDLEKYRTILNNFETYPAGKLIFVSCDDNKLQIEELFGPLDKMTYKDVKHASDALKTEQRLVKKCLRPPLPPIKSVDNEDMLNVSLF